MSKSGWLQIRLSEAEQDEIKQAADYARKTVSEYVRTAALGNTDARALSEMSTVPEGLWMLALSCMNFEEAREIVSRREVNSPHSKEAFDVFSFEADLLVLLSHYKCHPQINEIHRQKARELWNKMPKRVQGRIENASKVAFGLWGE